MDVSAYAAETCRVLFSVLHHKLFTIITGLLLIIYLLSLRKVKTYC